MRRVFLIAGAAFAGLIAVSSRRGREEAPEEAVDVMEFDALGRSVGTRTVATVVKSASEWKAMLTAQQYYVTRQASTDTPYTGTFHELHTAGLYRCICCGTGLFRSEEKFDSGTGWPSFWAPADERNIRKRKDVSLLLERIEVACRRCGAHLGHVFPDGPPPTHLRYCINESSLRFAAYGKN